MKTLTQDINEFLEQPHIKEALFITRHTPNWPNGPADRGKARYTLLKFSVKVADPTGKGFSRAEAAKLAAKMERAVKGRSKTRAVSAII